MPRHRKTEEELPANDSATNEEVLTEDGEWLTADEASERLGIHRRNFQRYIAKTPIPHRMSGRSKLYRCEDVDMLTPDEEHEQQTEVSAMVREVARASKEIHMSAAIALKSAAEAIQGTDLRTGALLEELKRLRDHTDTLEAKYLTFWELMQTMHETRIAELHASARRERDHILENSRKELLSKSFELAWPGLVHRFFPSTKTETTIMGKVIRHLPPTTRDQILTLLLGSNLPDELGASVHALLQGAIEEQAKEDAKAKEKAPEAETPGA